MRVACANYAVKGVLAQMRQFVRPIMFGLAASTFLFACARKEVGLECMVPTFDVPTKKIPEAEARLYSSMCTESWAKRWAVKSK
jgi:hypothetical protein